LELGVVGVFLELAQMGHVHYPLVVFKVLGVEVSQKRICTYYPTPGRHSVCHVDEFSWEKLVEIFEEGSFE
jgi:hypothetical protein